MARPAQTEKSPKITFGADPEFLITNVSGGLIPSWELGITGTKGEPNPIQNGPPGSGILCDGVAVEVNVAPRDNLLHVANDVGRGIQHFLRTDPTAASKKPVLKWQVDSIEVQRKYHAHPYYKTIGCSPDLDAYSEDGIRKPFSAEDFGVHRFAGGHIHVGCDPWPEWLPKNVFIKFLDISYFSIGGGDFRANLRSKFYGMPGIWRETPYGVEYRSPNSAWLGWGDSLAGLSDTITRVLSVSKDTIKDQLAHFYNNGMIEEVRESFITGANYAVPVAIANDYFWQAMGGKLRSARPRALKLKGGGKNFSPEDVVAPRINRINVRYGAPNAAPDRRDRTRNTIWNLGGGAGFAIFGLTPGGIHYLGRTADSGALRFDIRTPNEENFVLDVIDDRVGRNYQWRTPQLEPVASPLETRIYPHPHWAQVRDFIRHGRLLNAENTAQYLDSLDNGDAEAPYVEEDAVEEPDAEQLGVEVAEAPDQIVPVPAQAGEVRWVYNAEPVVAHPVGADINLEALQAFGQIDVQINARQREAQEAFNNALDLLRRR